MLLRLYWQECLDRIGYKREISDWIKVKIRLSQAFGILMATFRRSEIRKMSQFAAIRLANLLTGQKFVL
jgi:hypothetical protein